MRLRMRERPPDRFGTNFGIGAGHSAGMTVMLHNSELPDSARIGALIGNPVRAQFIGILIDDSEHSAGALAARVHATPQSASAHLTSLGAGGFLTVRPRGVTGTIACAASRSPRRSRDCY